MTELVIHVSATDAEGRTATASVTVDVLEPQPAAAEGSRM
jgi:hypothetical protein